MPLNTLKTVAVLVLAFPALAADEKKDASPPAPSGSWVKKDGQLRIDFPDKGSMKVFPHGEKDSFVVVCSYTVAKDGTIQAKITDLEGKDEVKEKAKTILPVGLEFRFTWKAKGEMASLDDIQGKDVDVLKSHMEGEFAKTKSD